MLMLWRALPGETGVLGAWTGEALYGSAFVLISLVVFFLILFIIWKLQDILRKRMKGDE